MLQNIVVGAVVRSDGVSGRKISYKNTFNVTNQIEKGKYFQVVTFFKFLYKIINNISDLS